MRTLFLYSYINRFFSIPEKIPHFGFTFVKGIMVWLSINLHNLCFQKRFGFFSQMLSKKIIESLFFIYFYVEIQALPYSSPTISRNYDLNKLESILYEDASLSTSFSGLIVFVKKIFNIFLNILKRKNPSPNFVPTQLPGTFIKINLILHYPSMLPHKFEFFWQNIFDRFSFNYCLYILLCKTCTSFCGQPFPNRSWFEQAIYTFL